MAKKKYYSVGSVVKGKDGKPDYLKLRADNVEALVRALTGADKTKGLILNLESKKQKLEGIEAAAAAGKLKPEWAEKARERANSLPEFVRFDVTLGVEEA